MSGHRVTACLPLAANTSGFCLPLVSKQDDPKWYIQDIDEVEGKIVGFKQMLEIDDTLVVENGPPVSVGGEVVYAFAEQSGRVLTGTLIDLRDQLRALGITYRQVPAVLVQISELVGSRAEKKAARKEMRNVIRGAPGGDWAAESYVLSAARVSLWDKVIANAIDLESARRFLTVRRNISVSVSQGGRIEVDFHDVNIRDFATVSEGALIEELQVDFDFLLPSSATDTPTLDLELDDDGRANEAALRIRRLGRQEARVAAILREIAASPFFGKAVLNRYARDRAKFANRAIEIIRNNLTNVNADNTNIYLAKIVEELFRRVFPAQRGILLYFLAEYLAPYRLVNETITRLVSTSNSFLVRQQGSEIERFLEDGRRQFRN